MNILKQLKLRNKLVIFFLLGIFHWMVAIPMVSPYEVKFEQLHVQDGLSDPTITAIFKDSFGYLWIGTSNGLNRYNGYDFTVYRSNPKDSKALNEEYINCIFEGNDNNLMVGTWGGGLAIYNREKETFTHYKNDPQNNNSISHNWVRVIFKDSKGRIWIGTQNGLNLYHEENQSFTRYLTDIHDPENPVELELTSISEISEDSKGNLWIATWSGLIVFNPDQDRIVQVQKESHPSIISTNRLQSVYVDQFDDVWIGTYKAGLIRLKDAEIQDDEIISSRITYLMRPNSPEGISDLRINDICGDSLGNIWIATESGLNYYNFKNDAFSQYYFNTNDPNSLSSSFITNIYSDNEDILWVGTLDNGLCKYDKGIQKFPETFPEINQSSNPLTKYVKSVYQDSQNRYWIGTDNGLYLYSHNFKLLKVFGHDPHDNNSLDIGGVTGVCEDVYGQYWVVTWGGGLHRFDEATGKFQRLPRQGNDPFEQRKYDDPFDHNNLGDADVRSIQPDMYGRLWMGTSSGFIDYYDVNENKFYHHFIYDKDSIRGVPVTSLEISRKGNLWGGAIENGGLIQIDPKTKNIKRYFASLNKNSLLSNDVYSIAIDYYSNIWIGTDIGVCMLDTKTDSFINYSTQTGLTNQTVYNIEIDKNGDLWFSTPSELIQFNIDDQSKIVYVAEDGIRNNASTGITDNQGNIIVGGMNGISKFNPDDIPINKTTPNVVLTELRLFNEVVDFSKKNSVLKSHINSVDEIRLKHDQAFFSIGFAALNYSQTHKNQYLYKLEGIDKDWVSANNTRLANYTNIQPGTYTFHVIGSNNDGVWNNAGKSVQVIIDPPWYKSWWAYTIYISFILIAVFGVVRISVFREKLKNEIALKQLETDKNTEMINKEREVDQVKLQFFTNISHEFRTPLTLILGPAEDVLKKNNLDSGVSQNLSVIRKNAKRLLRLVNQIMDFSKVESGFMKFKVRKGDVAIQITNIVETFQYKAEKRNIRYIFTSTHSSINGYFDSDKIEKILYNLISNAFKFTPDGGVIEISTRFFKDGKLLLPDENVADNVEFKISDSGIGISEKDLENIFNRFYQGNKSSNGTGIGLSLAYSLVKIHGGEISVSSQKDCGSTFTLQLPLALDQMTDYEFINEEIINDEKISMLDIDDKEEEGPSRLQPAEDLFEDKNDDRNIVLIVEDNKDMQNYINSILAADYHLEFADNGEIGLKKALKLIPDLIVSDIMMPVKDGNELCDDVKSLPETSHIPVILLTAKANSEDRLKGLSSGADDYIVKPFESEELRLKINNILTTRSKLQAQFSSHGNMSVKTSSFNSLDDKFMKNVLGILEKNMSNPDFDHKTLGNEIGMSRAQLYRKMKALTNKSVHEIIRIYRLDKSLELLKDHGLTVSEVMYQVGFKNHSYFTKCFKEKFGISPTEYQNSLV